ncbi:MAG: radical SAM protein [Candidatus Omnitrophica bacterium]|nr:radical SAM protein [Candidatus Omnitrophota bacterium]
MDASKRISSSTDLKVCDYSRHGAINQYLAGVIGKEFRQYRKRWKEVVNLKRRVNFPLFLVLEPTFKCNLRCIMCMHSSKGTPRYDYKSRLPLKTYKAILDEASRYYCPSMTMGGNGEPLLDGRLADMIKLASRKGFIDIMLNTNGTLLTPFVSRRLIRSGLTRLRVGFDGLTKATYEKIRVGADYEKVKDNIVNFIKLRDKMNSRLPVVRINCVHLSENDKEIKGFIDFWKPVADYVSIQRYIPHMLTKRRLKLMPEERSRFKDTICSQPFERLYIRGNGDAYACCSVVYGPIVGNVIKDSIYDIWNSAKMRRLRAALLNNDWRRIPVCRDCMRSRYGAAI